MAVPGAILQIENLDIEVFAVPSQTTPLDGRSLLTIQNAVRGAAPGYVYLEVGSHYGGTLFPHLLDPLCRQVISVDKRPESQPDERGVIFDYNGNSTKRMLEGLRTHLSSSAMQKLITYDSDVYDLEASYVPVGVDLVFIDGEHTNVAVFRDFIGVERFLAKSWIVAFHDAGFLCDGLMNIEVYLKSQGKQFCSYFLPNSVFALASGTYTDTAADLLKSTSVDRDRYIHNSRIALWREIAKNSTLLQGDKVGHR
jgi:hypothetical protein